MTPSAAIPTGAAAPALRPRSSVGHFWTLASYLRNFVRPPEPPPSSDWRLSVRDAVVGEVRLSGRLSRAGGDHLVVGLHGIAGCSESAYSVRLAAAAAAAGVSCLRLNMRGADRSGQDLFHAGLTADLHAALASPELAEFGSLHVVGFSLGGHVALRAATQECHPRLASVAAICAPLDLGACADAFDRPSCWAYRRRILGELSGMYELVARRRPLAVPAERVRGARSLREFDGLTVAPRFGFADAEDYYQQMSVGPRLGRLRVPALAVVGVSDPLVPLATITPFLNSPSPLLDVRYRTDGGHVGFPARMRLSERGAPGLEAQAVEWLVSRPAPA